MILRALLAMAVALPLAACCEPGPPSHAPVARHAPPRSSTTASAKPAPPPDPLGPRPIAPAPATYQPPAPTVFTAHGITVWLLERHALPMVAMTMTVPSGSSSDPKGKEGLASATANMLDEGAGSRGAIELARAIDALGASLSSDADADASSVSLTSLKRNLDDAFGIFADVIARPKLDPREWARVRELWENDLKSQLKDPAATLRVVYRVALFGPDHPYGHPVDGNVASAQRVTLADVRSFYGSIWRPDRATLVAAGDVTQAEIAALVDKAFATWRAPASAPPPAVAPAAAAGLFPRVVIVDRPDASQSVIAVVRPGVAASDPDEAPLVRVNVAIGGGFTSRLNQDLREDHGWSYGASSRPWFSRGQGAIVATAAVRTDATADALKAMLADLDDFAKKGLTDDEVQKTRFRARADLVQAFETVDGAAARLARDVALGLPPDHEATASARRDAASHAVLNGLAAKYYDPAAAMIVIVGPSAKIAPDLAKLSLPPAQMRDAEGKVLTTRQAP